MIKQNLWVSKARIPITNTPPNQLAKAILHSFSWSFKTLSHPCLKLLYFYCSPVSWDHLEGRPGVPSLLWGVSRNLWCKCWCISSDAGHTKRISQRGKAEFTYSGPHLFSESPYQLHCCGTSAQLLVIFTFTFTLLLTFKETLSINFVRPFSSYELMFWTVVLSPRLSCSSTTRITAFFLFLPQFSFLLILSNTSLPCGGLSINLKGRWFETKSAVVLLSIAIIS